MKKLMIAAAAAAMIGGAYAARDAQVYDFSAALKTTQCKDAKVTKALEDYFGGFFEKGDRIGLRKQASRTLVGVIWGCDCPTIQNPMWRTYNGETVGGYMFWDQAANDYFRVTRTKFGWQLLNRIDAMNKCEGAFVLANDVDGQAMYLFGAGFGTVKDEFCDAYVPSISGNIAGFRQPNNVDVSNCVFCRAGNNCIVRPLCDVCSDAFTEDAGRTIAYGTWKIKFNSSMSKKLAKDGRLSNVFKFKKAGQAQAVLARIEDLVAEGLLAEREFDFEEDEEIYEEDDGEELDITQIADMTDEDGEKLLFPTEEGLETPEEGFEMATAFIDGDAS